MMVSDQEHFMLNLVKIGEGVKGLLLPDRRFDDSGTLRWLCAEGWVARDPETLGFHRYKVTADGDLQLRRIAYWNTWNG